MGNNPEADPLKTIMATIKFDLMHAFFHYQGDPNYTHLHWALYGNLEDRVELRDPMMDWIESNTQGTNEISSTEKRKEP
jgi:hypothetical protein